MSRAKKLLCALVAMILVISAVSVPIFADNSASVSDKTNSSSPALLGAKEEVVYATLDSNGETIEAYVVNILDIKSAGTFIDYGAYSTVENLTTTDDIRYKNDTVTGYANEGKYYYQGNIDHAKLPWNIDITYTLNDNTVSAQNLGGASGKLGINIKTSQAPNMPSSFYDHYILQMSVTLSSSKCKNIAAQGATIANAGMDKLVTITALPGKDSDNTITADVENFSMAGISINAVPYNMNIEMPDTSTMTGQFSTLSEGIHQLDSGVAKLKEGAAQFADGQELITDGSIEIMNGLEQLNVASDTIVQGSKEISEALVFISQTINESLTDEDIQQIQDLYEEMDDLNKILKEVPDVLDGMSSASTALFNALKIAIDAIPDDTVTKEEISELYEKNPGSAALGTLVQTYYAAQTVKTTFAALGPALESSNESMAATMRILSTEIEELSKKADELLQNQEMIDQIKQLREGMELLAENYKNFDAGIVQFTDGISMLADNYPEFDAGLSDAADGFSQLKDGIDALNNGSHQLYNGTKNLPQVVENAINSMTAEYDHSDFSPVSYTSEKNENVNGVQFVFSTNPIEPTVEEVPVEENEKELTLIDRIVNLFKKIFGKEDK